VRKSTKPEQGERSARREHQLWEPQPPNRGQPRQGKNRRAQWPGGHSWPSREACASEGMSGCGFHT